MSDPALDSNVWQAYAANPAHQATRIWRMTSKAAQIRAAEKILALSVIVD